MTDQERLDWIDNASYRDLLEKWRFAASGDPYFVHGPVVDHYKKVMAEKKAATGDNGVSASKQIGW